MARIKLIKANLKRVLTFEHPPGEAFPDQGKLALLAVLAGCGKRQVERYAPVEDLIKAGWIERAKNGRLSLCESAIELLGLEVTEKKEPDSRIKPLIGAYRDLMKERFHFDPAEEWDDSEWGNYSRAAQKILRVASIAPQVKGASPERVLEFAKQTLRAMIYTEDKKDFAYYNGQGWDFWVLAKSFNRYVFRMRSLQASQAEERKAAAELEFKRSKPRTFHGPRRLGEVAKDLPSLAEAAIKAGCPDPDAKKPVTPVTQSPQPKQEGP